MTNPHTDDVITAVARCAGGRLPPCSTASRLDRFVTLQKQLSDAIEGKSLLLAGRLSVRHSPTDAPMHCQVLV